LWSSLVTGRALRRGIWWLLFILRVRGGRVNPPWVSFYNTKTVFRSVDFPDELLLFAAANELAALFAAIGHWNQRQTAGFGLIRKG